MSPFGTVSAAMRGSMRTPRCAFGAWLLASFLLGTLSIRAAEGPASAPAPSSSASCLECHSDETLSFKRGGKKISLFVDQKQAAKSVHGSLECVDCHEKFDGDAIPHRTPIAPVDCTSCHDDLGKKHAFHPRLAAKDIPAGEDTSCVACHGSHGIAAAKASPFLTSGAAQRDACGKCHTEARDHFVASAHGRALAAHEKSAPDCLTCHRAPVVAARDAKPTLEQKLAQTRQCESCHVDKPDVASHAIRGTKFVSLFESSVHGAALQKGDAKAANCVDCHGAHEMNRAMAADARINKLRVAETCGQCHEKTAHEFKDSVHAAALNKGNLDSATCTDCHGEHDILGRKDPNSPVHAANVAQQVCANCHASLKLTKKYGIASHTFQTFADSYHGLAVRGGSVEVVNCASCHSSHAIRSQDDPASSTNKANLVQTCGQCHPGANTRFAVGKVHVSPEAAKGSDGNDPILYIVSTLYIILIVVVVGGMFVHNLLDFIKKIRRKLAIQKGLIEEEHVAHRLYLRMTAHERVQHAILVLSFVTLVITGFMLRYPDAWWVVAIRNLSTEAFELRTWSHRIAGVVMILAGIWHIGYLFFTKPGRSLLRDLLPKWRDCTDPIGVLKYNLGLSPTKPAFGRFSYIEKAEYWALVWGTILMGITGAILWFENTSMGLFTKLGFDISRTVHFYEAILATLAIIVWHFYFVIFNPDIYPMNLSWLTGRMSEKEMLEEHPLELERLKQAEAQDEKPETKDKP
ncbi:cytochrome c3 family protein [Opitutus sp. ER46]|uniref:cytochrome c3 family protein n=1 Tax=Opitutus sp. ER46 TaxID=2161864 RepID=UPI000D2F9CF7|nr:cytochrome c3 family protein [Opitutus sp. ER46]PTX91593.1 cytochrome B [Opitutus sp. ER46]